MIRGWGTIVTDVSLVAVMAIVVVFYGFNRGISMCDDVRHGAPLVVLAVGIVHPVVKQDNGSNMVKVGTIDAVVPADYDVVDSILG